MFSEGVMINMLEAVIVAIITGVFSLTGILISSKATQNKIMAELKTHQAVTDTKLEALTREVREHNNFARRVPVVEEQIKVLNHRVADLESERRGA